MNLQCLNENGQYKIDYCIIYDVDIYDERIANSFHIIFGADNRKCLISKRKNGVLQPNPYFKELDKKFSSFNLCYQILLNRIYLTAISILGLIMLIYFLKTSYMTKHRNYGIMFILSITIR